MRIRGTCDACNRDFLFVQLYSADPAHADRCPRCDHHLGIVGIAQLALAADRAATNLVRVLEGIAARDRAFTVERASVIDRIDEAARATASRHRDAGSPTTPHRQHAQRLAA